MFTLKRQPKLVYAYVNEASEKWIYTIMFNDGVFDQYESLYELNDSHFEDVENTLNNLLIDNYNNTLDDVSRYDVSEFIDYLWDCNHNLRRQIRGIIRA